MDKFLEKLGFDKQKWKWRYLITYPLLFIVIGVLFILTYSALIILLMSI